MPTAESRTQDITVAEPLEDIVDDETDEEIDDRANELLEYPLGKNRIQMTPQWTMPAINLTSGLSSRIIYFLSNKRRK